MRLPGPLHKSLSELKGHYLKNDSHSVSSISSASVISTMVSIFSIPPFSSPVDAPADTFDGSLPERLKNRVADFFIIQAGFLFDRGDSYPFSRSFDYFEDLLGGGEVWKFLFGFNLFGRLF